ncbi:hypothetical protein F4808DRAFT_405685 [Astrocystis sublimbata]|nr:hypothetical protein F4808DRAFT_405685 [Astrocystis sublimbata]
MSFVYLALIFLNAQGPQSSRSVTLVDLKRLMSSRCGCRLPRYACQATASGGLTMIGAGIDCCWKELARSSSFGCSGTRPESACTGVQSWCMSSWLFCLLLGVEPVNRMG